VRKVLVRKGAYRDSVTLMQATQELNRRSDVANVLVAMATDLNLELLDQLGFTRPAATAPSDLVIAVEADEAELDTVLEAVDSTLNRQSRSSATGPAAGPPAQTVTAAARRGAPTLALVSTPGRVAAIDAADALANGLDVMIFSDNVGMAEEIRLKDLASRAGLLVMGPDCGTAIVDGIGLGFANVVRPGPVGIVAASGTGAQQVLALLDGSDVGVTYCLGVGGRDLSDDVGGRSTITALDRLDRENTVELIVLISKTPGPAAAARVEAHLEQFTTPVVVGYLGPGQPDLTATSARAVEALGRPWAEPARLGAAPARSPGYLRGLFVGGTLCDEAAQIAGAAGYEVFSNITKDPTRRLGTDLAPRGHSLIDFGDDQLTSGRPHPMIDPSLRLQRLGAELADDSCGVVLLDVVLGHGAHPDPATDLAPVIASAAKPVVVTVVGTRDDPQGAVDTAARLATAGAVVHASNAAAAREALDLVSVR
jgi:FdrA protein